MSDPSELKYTSSHEWVRVEGKTIIVGITDYAQALLADITNIELPEPDEHHHYEKREDVCVIESLRTSHDMRAPVAGTITEINTELLSNPEIVNEDPYGEGWLIRMKPDDMRHVERLMDIYRYEENLPEEEEE
ncbi:MAG: glycine cleavage system protein H [Lentisphaerae bacterium RIFOXYC12_FULL_60_16]|nr:MAG: glycine cleavage system protein H [Lentisphaerae bacterium RIFOXYC12_FULL_60_16]OGV86893.1 MAG: glycine cleavage system protein H [Lentisphaerae bacterium RIFOXYB12_FULL_60_10]